MLLVSSNYYLDSNLKNGFENSFSTMRKHSVFPHRSSTYFETFVIKVSAKFSLKGLFFTILRQIAIVICYKFSKKIEMPLLEVPIVLKNKNFYLGSFFPFVQIFVELPVQYSYSIVIKQPICSQNVILQTWKYLILSQPC